MIGAAVMTARQMIGQPILALSQRQHLLVAADA
jgi:hypothetical protein